MVSVLTKPFANRSRKRQELKEEERFEYDVFMSFSARDAAKVSQVAASLRRSNISVCLEDGVIRPGEPAARSRSYLLERCRTLVLFMSSNALASEWPRLESEALRFRDPLNQAKRFVPVRLDDAEPPESLRDSLFVDLRQGTDSAAVNQLVDACRPPAEPVLEPAKARHRLGAMQRATHAYPVPARVVAISSSGETALLGAGATIHKASVSRVRQNAHANWLSEYRRLPHGVEFLNWDEQGKQLIAASPKQMSVLDLAEDGRIKVTLDFGKSRIFSISQGESFLAAGLSDGTIRLIERHGSYPAKMLRGHTKPVTTIAPGPTCIVSGSEDATVRLWSMSGRCVQVMEGHTAAIRHVIVDPSATQLASCGDDGVIRLWDLSTGLCSRVFAGHTASVHRLSWSIDGRFFVSSGADLTIRLWDSQTGECLAVLDGHRTDAHELRWASTNELVSSDITELRRWDLTEALSKAATLPPREVQADADGQVLYTNAKVLLVGESGAGKTGLSKRLALDSWELSASTVGAWATQWKLPVEGGDQGIEREIWLWDFGGQADQRLIHQLYMDETSLVVHIFDGQKAEVFDSLKQWDNDLRRASHSEFVKLLVAGRVDASPLRITRANLEAFCREHSYRGFFETSARTGQGCKELKTAIVQSIDWERIPWRSSPRLFKLLKEEIVSLKDSGKILMRFNDLREMLALRLHGQSERFTDAQLKAVLSLLAGPGVISELEFGGWILFQPQLINVYAQAVLRTMLEDQSELGCLLESDVLAGQLSFHDLERVPPDEEKFILIAMNHTLLSRGLCSKEQTEAGTLLVFPSYYKRQRPELQGHPAILVSYVFEGFVPEIYSTLVVRLHHTSAFVRDKLWQDAADFRTASGSQIGIKLSKERDGSSTLEVYVDPATPLAEKILFVRYVHEHLRQRAVGAVVRRRHYVCSDCGQPVADIKAPAIRLERGLKDIGCATCDFRIPLLDEIEAMYSSASVAKQVQGMEDSVEIELDNESKERLLVGEVISAVALANQICREKTVSDHGIDAEIEFKDDGSNATGQMIYLQLKSGDSYLRTTADGTETFTIKKRRHAKYWMEQNCPVMLVIRSSDGEIRWMEIREYLREEYKGRKAQARTWRRKPDDEETLPTSIEFRGEPFNIASILKWRQKLLEERSTVTRRKPQRSSKSTTASPK